MSVGLITGDKTERPGMRRQGRLALGVVGVLSWLAGGVAAFVSDNGAGAAALVAVGALAGAISAIGRWPTRVVFSGQELSWADVRETVESQIQTAREGERPAAALAELAVLRERLDRLALTGEVPRHPAAEYDDHVADALQRVAPTASRLLRTEVRSRVTADFELISDDRRVFVETKWRRDPAIEFRGETLPRLVAGLPPNAPLVVVTNSVDVKAFRSEWSSMLGSRARLVSWRQPADDDALREALTALMSG
ncbi:MAG: hypothetical protein ACRDWI_17500 [Jiangellaceae bacterium]